MKKLHKYSAGFTLIEIMVVIVIMGIMAALVVPRVMGSADQARIAAAKADIQSIMTALKLYKLDNIRYPTSQQGLDALVTAPTLTPIAINYKNGGYLEKLPKDPWGNDYQYDNPGKHGEIDIYSFGPDGENTSTNDDTSSNTKIIGNWD